MMMTWEVTRDVGDGGEWHPDVTVPVRVVLAQILRVLRVACEQVSYFSKRFAELRMRSCLQSPQFSRSTPSQPPLSGPTSESLAWRSASQESHAAFCCWLSMIVGKDCQPPHCPSWHWSSVVACPQRQMR